MRTVELTPGIISSALGFGCASVLGSVNANDSSRALEVAIECGINHFDLARSYGYGEAEKLVGKILKGRRDKMVVVSKFGIKATWNAGLLRPIKPLYRFAREKLKSFKDDGPQVLPSSKSSISDNFLCRPPLSKKLMITSLDQSLRALNTDYLDYFLVHEPLHGIERIEELYETSKLLIKQGKIRGWGLAYYSIQETLHSSYLKDFDLLQFEIPLGISNYQNLVAGMGSKSNVLFSPFKNRMNGSKPADILSMLFSDFPNSVVLFSTFNEQHIRENAHLCKV